MFFKGQVSIVPPEARASKIMAAVPAHAGNGAPNRCRHC